MPYNKNSITLQKTIPNKSLRSDPNDDDDDDEITDQKTNAKTPSEMSQISKIVKNTNIKSLKYLFINKGPLN